MFYYRHTHHIEGFKRILSDEELHRLFSHIDDDMHKLFFHLMFVKGKRISELCPLNIRDIDLSASLMVTWVRKKRGAGSRRITYLDPHDQDMLEHFIQEHAASIKYSGGFIFYNQRSGKGYKSADAMGHIFDKLRAAAGLDKKWYPDKHGNKRKHVRSHSLRATAINKVLEATNGDLRAAIAFSQHGSMNAIYPYIDEYERRKLTTIETKTFKGFKEKKLTLYLD